MSIEQREGEGIVLRHEDQHKYTVFDKEAGKIESRSYHHIRRQLFVGCVITYRACRRGAWNSLDDIHLLDMPVCPEYADLMFFHHLLELCYFFLPWDFYASDVYELVMLLYAPSGALKSATQKLMFLCHFFYILGIYPRWRACQQADYFRLISQPLNSKLSMSLTDEDQKRVYEWIAACMRLSPHYNRFKTGSVFTTMREEMYMNR